MLWIGFFYIGVYWLFFSETSFKMYKNLTVVKGSISGLHKPSVEWPSFGAELSSIISLRSFETKPELLVTWTLYFCWLHRMIRNTESLLAAAAEHSDVFAILSIKVVFCDNLACLIVIKHFHQAETHVQNACVREGKGRERREERGENKQCWSLLS